MGHGQGRDRLIPRIFVTVVYLARDSGYMFAQIATRLILHHFYTNCYLMEQEQECQLQ